MKKQIFALLLLSISALSFTGCRKKHLCEQGRGGMVTETRVFSDFSGIDLNVSADLYIFQDPDIKEPELLLEGQANVLENLITDVPLGNTLRIKFQECVNHHRKLSMELRVKNIHEIKINGSGDVIAKNTILSKNIGIEIKGSGDVYMGLEAEKVSVKIDGSGDAHLRGITGSGNYSINGSGKIKAFEMKSQDVEININGSGKSEVKVEKSLKVRINGSGDVFYKGAPNLDVSISGTGKIKKSN